MKKTSPNKPLQIVISKKKDGFSVFSQSLKGVEKSDDGLDLQGVARFIKKTKLGTVTGFE